MECPLPGPESRAAVTIITSHYYNFFHLKRSALKFFYCIHVIKFPLTNCEKAPSISINSTATIFRLLYTSPTFFINVQNTSIGNLF